MNKKRIVILFIIGIAIAACVIMGISYAFFTGGVNTTNGNISYNTTFNSGNYNFTAAINSASVNGVTLNITAANMVQGSNDSVADSYDVMFDISFQNTSGTDAYCTYDYVWVWDTTSPNQYVISTDASKELTVSGAISEMQVPNYVDGKRVLGKASIQASANSTETRQDTLTTKFYNLTDVSQTSHSDKNYRGFIMVANAHCSSSSSVKSIADYLAYDAPRAGYDAVSGSQWFLTEDHEGELRYAGKNPNNYISFNGELWRIIGVMPDMEYCTGTYGSEDECATTSKGSLVKIVRNDSLGSFIYDKKSSTVGTSLSSSGSGDWSDSQLMLMLNGSNYLKTSYDKYGTQLHTNYTVTNNVVADGNGHNFYNDTYSYLDGNGTTVYKPSTATTSSYTATAGTVPKKISLSALSKIVTAKWDLYGVNSWSTDAEGNPQAFYNKERNIGGTGFLYTASNMLENRAAYWYGKVGLIYPSDYGYATSGGSTYSRTTCLGTAMTSSGWGSGAYKSDCVGNDYLWYTGITSNPPGSSGGGYRTLTSSSINNVVLAVDSSGGLSNLTVSSSDSIRPVVYLKADTLISGNHAGSWNDPYTIKTPDFYWADFFSDEIYEYPSHANTTYSSMSTTSCIGQNDSEYFACMKDEDSGNELCLSQPYTQYGLTGHTLNSNFTSAQQTSAKQALYQTLINAGFNISLSDCTTSSGTIKCNINNYSWYGIYNTGIVFTNRSGSYATVNYNGTAYCINDFEI